MLKISIIIPAYNSEKYISACLNSVYSQDMSLSEYEVIIVNDGSCDKTAEIAKKSLRENGIYLYQENQRQGAARNNGLRIARGEYVWFVDSDDEIFPNILNTLYETAKSNNLDALFFGFERRFIDGNFFRSKSVAESGKVYSGRGYLALRDLTLSPCYVFKRKYLIDNNLFFLEKTVFEDAELLPRICFFASRVMYSDCMAYIAIKRANSTTTTFSLKNTVDALKMSKKIFSFADSEHNTDLYFYSVMVFNTFFYRYRRLNEEAKSEILKTENVSKKNILTAMMRSGRVKYKIEALVLFFLWWVLF